MKIYLAGKVGGRKWRLVDPFKHRCTFIASDGRDATHGLHGWKGSTILGPECWQQCNDGKFFFEKNVLDRIRESDGLIAYLYTDDSYGSIAEIAFASAIGKPCHMIVEEHPTDSDYCLLHDAYWFVGTFPGVRVRHARSEQEAGDCVVDILDELGVQVKAYAYFVEAVGKNEIKIGTAADPEQRLRQLQIGNGSELRLLGVMRGGRDLEDELHRKFDHLRIRADGEWFRATDELRRFIAENIEAVEHS